jgi:hypothetical protein
VLLIFSCLSFSCFGGGGASKYAIGHWLPACKHFAVQNTHGSNK